MKNNFDPATLKPGDKVAIWSGGGVSLATVDKVTKAHGGTIVANGFNFNMEGYGRGRGNYGHLAAHDNPQVVERLAAQARWKRIKDAIFRIDRIVVPWEAQKNLQRKADPDRLEAIAKELEDLAK